MLRSIVVLALLPAWASAQTIVYVDSNASGMDDGTSWQDAYVSLDIALDNAEPGNEVWVAAETYVPADHETGFVLPDGVAVYGGFAGDEATLEERDSQANPTILSGDFFGDDVADLYTGLRCLADIDDPGCERFDTNGDGSVSASELGVDDNRERVVTVPLVEFALIDGFVITAAFGRFAAGLCVEGSGQMVINDCTFLTNRSAGVSCPTPNLCAELNAHIASCSFRQNVSWDVGAGTVFGAGLRLVGETVTIEDTEFIENVIGGGLVDCMAAGAHVTGSEVRITGSRFERNELGCFFADSDVNASALQASGGVLEIANSEFIGNISGDTGWVMRAGASESGEIVNVTVANNSNGGVRVSHAFGEPIRITNSIVWGNGGQSIADVPYVAVSHSLIEGGFAGESVLDVDPQFVDPLGPDDTAGTSDDDLRLSPTSPAIDAGSSAAALAVGLGSDLDQQPRYFNLLALTDAGVGPGPVVDIGAYEFRCAVCGDEDENGIRDDPCVWQACTGESCVQIDVVFADMGGQFGECMPDGTADTNDRFHALNCFANTSVAGIGGYECENQPDYPATAYNVDAGGPFGACSPDGVCDGNDAFHALAAFNGSTTCACPLDGGPAPVILEGTTAVRAVVRLQADRKVIRPGEVVNVDAFLDTPLAELRGYQLHLESTGGYGGGLELVDIAVHSDSVLQDADYPWTAFNVQTHQMITGVDRAGVAVSTGHLATFTYRAAAETSGRFTIELLAGTDDNTHRTYLFPSHGGERIVVSSRALNVNVTN